MSDQKSLFVEMTSEESAHINGGDALSSNVSLDLGSYIFMIGAGTLFGNPGLTQTEIQFAWEKSIVMPTSGGLLPLPGAGGFEPV